MFEGVWDEYGCAVAGTVEILFRWLKIYSLGWAVVCERKLVEFLISLIGIGKSKDDVEWMDIRYRWVRVNLLNINYLFLYYVWVKTTLSTFSVLA